MQTSKFNILILVLLTCFGMLACGGNQKAAQADAEAAAFKAMMDVHDEVMPKMGAINRLSRQLKEAQNSVDTSNRELLGRIDQSIRALETADQGMMAWMNANAGDKLTQLQAEKSHEEILAYIKGEAENINTVKENMFSSIEQAEALLKEIPQEAGEE